MSLQTLEEFLISSKMRAWPSNAYVRAPGFKELYVRRTRRLLDGEWVESVLDIARAKATRPGKGVLTALITNLLERGIPLYMECVQNKRFVKRLEKMGFTLATNTLDGAPSFFKLPKKQKRRTDDPLARDSPERTGDR